MQVLAGMYTAAAGQVFSQWLVRLLPSAKMHLSCWGPCKHFADADLAKEVNQRVTASTSGNAVMNSKASSGIKLVTQCLDVQPDK